MTAVENPAKEIAVLGTGTDGPLRRYATLIQELSGVPARVLRIETDELVPALGSLPGSTAAVFVSHLPSGAALSAAVPVVTGQQSTAVTLTAAALTALTRSGRAPNAARVVIVGADALPPLGVLLMAAGIGDITAWRERDASAYPLTHVTRNADAVIDLLGACPVGSVPNLLQPGTGVDRLLALPGLLRALCGTPWATVEVETLLACVFALVMATRPGDLLPARLDLALTAGVADAAFGALPRRPRRPDLPPTR
ncbi:malate dehydrogenase (oxaloacetate-decarboxylating) [Crossiella equi]|uniref:Malate dehydrogenase (Oxaloacetate-decarboxylating) n=1 Tax=Crossiella equi TaxID=130796 RepID=A0ABS5APH5_9PSEU|nr:hypothetical protein [Crossiella equi]MBP2478477.1 malate dehydrogenase (oxaloacetate-decarboxylating) [Crossiella equi]